jgi:transcriptional regulator with XRE-family HTH domain
MIAPCQYVRMGSKQRAVDRGSARARVALLDLAAEIRKARETHGLSQAVVGGAVGLSASQISRLELGEVQNASIWALSRILAVVGLDMSILAYPTGAPMRDAAQLALLARFCELVPDCVQRRTEVPLPIAGDLRAWDLLLRVGARQVAVEAETRPRDMQALLRRVALKRRDDPRIGDVLLLLLADTRHNRALIREHGPTLSADFPASGPELRRALIAGHDPGGSGVILM